jgi:hypothetical protein
MPGWCNAVKVWLLAKRNHPEQPVKLSGERIRDLPTLIAGAQQLNLAVTATPRADDLDVGHNLLRGIPVKLS